MIDYGECHTSCDPLRIDAEKDPDATEDFAIDWSGRLGADTLTASTWTLPDGLVSVSETSNATQTAIFVSGGSCHRVYRLVNHVVSAGGRSFDQTLRIRIRQA